MSKLIFQNDKDNRGNTLGALVPGEIFRFPANPALHIIGLYKTDKLKYTNLGSGEIHDVMKNGHEIIRISGVLTFSEEAS